MKQIFKAGVVTALIGILLIPTWFINGLVVERKKAKENVQKEVALHWGDKQTVTTPYIQTTYFKNTATGLASNISGKGYIMPQNNTTLFTIKTNKLYRGIYAIPVYESVVSMKGSFTANTIERFKKQYGTVQWENSFLSLNISDVRGLSDSATILLNGSSYPLQLNENKASIRSLQIPLSMFTSTANEELVYEIKFSIKGSETFSTIPLAAQNTISIQSNWNNPSFEGLTANEKSIAKNGVTAHWKINGNSLSIPAISDSWPDTSAAGLSIHFLNGVDSYIKTSRCIKYAILFIGLTFTLFFFIELYKNTHIHPIQYALVGIALVIFYTLLLSISEYLYFDYAYLISSLATIILIALYSKSVTQSASNGILVGGVLVVLYSFMYLIIQLKESSLLVGSIGLFTILAIIMYFSRKIKWETNIIQTIKNEINY